MYMYVYVIIYNTELKYQEINRCFSCNKMVFYDWNKVATIWENVLAK